MRLHIYTSYLKEALKKYSHFCFEFVIIDFLVTPTHLIIQCQIVTISENKKTIKISIAKTTLHTILFIFYTSWK